MRMTLALIAGGALTLGACTAKATIPDETISIEVQADPRIAEADARQYEAHERVWVCHRGRWQDISGAAAAAHMRHGDAVSSTMRASRSSC